MSQVKLKETKGVKFLPKGGRFFTINEPVNFLLDQKFFAPVFIFTIPLQSF